MSVDYQSKIPPGMLMRVIQAKQDIIVYYESLHKIALGREAADIIRDILLDERNHLELFSNLYTDLFREQPEPPADGPPPSINSFIDGVKHSLMRELSTYNFYGNVFFTDQNEEVRNIFLRALFDENAHSAKLNYIYTGLLGNGVTA